MIWLGIIILCCLIMGFLILTSPKKQLRNDGDISDIAWRLAVKQGAEETELAAMRKRVVPATHTGRMAGNSE